MLHKSIPHPFLFLSLLLAALLLGCSGQGTDDQLTLPRSAQPITGIAFVTESGMDRDIFIMDVDGSNQALLISSPKVDSDPAISPDGRTLAFRSRRDGSSEIYLVAADGSGAWLNLVNDHAQSFDDEFNPAWHPLGNALALYTDRFQPPIGNCLGLRGVHHIGFIQLTEQPLNIRHFDQLAGEQETLAWSPDGRHLAFGSICREQNVRIFLWDTETDSLLPITDESFGAANPAFSPDGKYLAFSATRDGPTDIMIYDLATGSIRNLTNSPSKDRHPTWSPDGQWIAFTSDEAGNDDIFKIRIDGSERQNLTQRPGRDLLPNWSPIE